MRALPIDDFFETIDGSSRTAPYDWSRLIEEGRAARAEADGGSWRIGRLALMVERRYASGALRRFAEEIGESLGSVRRFRWVADAYDDATRARFGGLSFSHFQAVASLPDRLVWLERARRGGWSVDRLTSESRVGGTERGAQAARLRRSIESATRSVTRLTAQLDRVRVSRAVRQELEAAVDELTAELDQLRARLRSAPKRPLQVARSR